MTQKNDYINVITLALFILAYGCSFMPFEALRLEFFMAATSLLFVFGAVLSWRTKLTWPKRNALTLTALAFWGLAFASIFWSVVPYLSVIAFFKFSLLPLSFFLLIMIKDEKLLRRLLAGAFGIAMLVAAFAILQFIAFPEMLYKGMRAAHPYQNPNTLAGLAAPLSLITLAAPFLLKKISHRYIAFTLVLIPLAALMVTASRGGMIALTLAGILFLFLMRKDLKVFWKPMAAFGILAVLCSLIIGMNTNFSASPVEAVTTLTTEKYSNHQRIALWTSTYQLIKERPILGHGIGTFKDIYGGVRSPSDLSAGKAAHNDPLQFWLEMGIAGLVLFYVFVGLAAWRTYKALSQKSLKLDNKVLIAASFCALLTLIAHAHITFHLQITSLLFTCGILLAVWYRATATALHEGTGQALPHIARQCLMALGVLGALAIFAFSTSEYLCNRAPQYIERGAFEKLDQRMQLAKTLSFHLHSRPYLVNSSVPIGLLKPPSTVPPEQQERLYHYALAELAAAEPLNPYKADLYYRKAALYMVAPAGLLSEPRQQLIEENLQRAIAVDPLHIESSVALLKYYQETGQHKELQALHSKMPVVIKRRLGK